jgi:hypothetical protein
MTNHHHQDRQVSNVTNDHHKSYVYSNMMLSPKFHDMMTAISTSFPVCNAYDNNEEEIAFQNDNFLSAMMPTITIPINNVAIESDSFILDNNCKIKKLLQRHFLRRS